MVHLLRNGTETVLLQRNDSLQWIETGCETFQEKRFEDYFAMVLEIYIRFRKVEGEMLMQR
jgi:hypothetical protein